MDAEDTTLADAPVPAADEVSAEAPQAEPDEEDLGPNLKALAEEAAATPAREYDTTEV
jgi:hypothetical protein